MRKARFPITVSVALSALLHAPAAAVETEDGPAFLTDSHGASGVVHAFLKLSEIDPQYEKQWQGALDWLIYVAQRDEQGRMAWPMSTSAPEGHPNRRLNVMANCHIARMFIEGYRTSGEARYKDAAIAGVRTLVERFARQKETRLGTAWCWSHGYRPGDESAGVLAGHSHGLGNPLDLLLEAYALSRDPRLEEPLRGILVNLRTGGRETEGEGGTRLAWPALKNPDVYETGYCYGQAGIALPLLRMAELLPHMKLKDGTTALSMANANLRYLMSVARQQGDGYVWPHMRHEETTRNIGYGSGTGGIGWAFLRGAEVNRKSDPAFAAECEKYARGAARYATELVHNYRGPQRLTSPGGDGGFGVCGGAGGAGHFLMRYAEHCRQDDPALAERIDEAIARIAHLVAASAERLQDGTMVCPDRQHFRRINLALDYGQTGVVLGLAWMGQYLKDEEILAVARRVADYIAKQAVAEGGGLKFAQFQPLPERGER